MIESKVSSLNGYLANLPRAQARARRDRREPLHAHRLPAAHRRGAVALVRRAETGRSLREASEDLFWALLNSREFAFNH